MTKNKKKLRRAEKRYSVTKSAQTLVLAGLLLAGGVTGALAGDNLSTTGDGTYTTPITITDRQETILNHTFEQGLTISGSVNGEFNGINNAALDKTVTISGGLSEMTAGAGISTGTLVISGGDINVEGIMAVSDPDKPRWRAGTMLSGDKEVKVTGSTVNVGKNGQLVVGYKGSGSGTYTGMKITSGTVNLKGGLLRASSATTGFDFSKKETYSTITISGGADREGTLNTVSGSYSVIASRDTILTNNATMNINGLTTMVGAMLDDKTSNTLPSDTPSYAPEALKSADFAAEGKLTLENGGRLNVANSGALLAGAIDFVQTGGEFTTNKLSVGVVANAKAGDGAFFESYTQSAGFTTADTLTVGATGTVDIKADGALTIAALDLQSGGTINIDGNNAVTDNEARINFTKDITFAASQFGDTADTANKINITNAGRIWVQGQLTLKDNDSTAGQVLDTAGAVKTYSLRVLNAAGTAPGDLTVTGANQFQHDGRIVIAGGDNTDPNVDVVTAGTMTATGNGNIEFGEGGFAGSGRINANLVAGDNTAPAASKAGTIEVCGGTWKLATGKILDVQANGTLSVGEVMLGGGMSDPANLDVSQGTLKVDALGTAVVKQLSSLKADFGNFGSVNTGVTSFTGNGTVNLGAFTNNGTLILTDTGLTSVDLTQFAVISSGIMNGNDQGTIKLDGVTIAIKSTDTLQQVGEAHASAEKSTVAGGPMNGGAAEVGGVTGSAKTALSNNASLALTGQGAANGKLTEAGVTMKAATLTMGNAANKDFISGTLVGGIDASESTGGQANTINTVKGDFTVVGGIKGGAGDEEIKVLGSSLHVDSINLSGGGTDVITVGNSTSSGVLTADNVKLAGATLFLDPSWVDGKEYQDAGDASRAAIDKFSAGIDGIVMVGQNSQLSLGTTSTEQLTDAIRQMGNVWGASGISAALGIYSPQTLASGGAIEVADRTSASTPVLANHATFADKSLLVVNAAGIGDGVALSGVKGTSILTVDANAKLRITGGKAGTVHIVSDFTNASSVITSGGWNGANLTSDTALLDVEGGSFTAGAYDVKLTGKDATAVFPMLSGSMGGLVNRMVQQHGVDPDSTNMGIKFISRAASDSYIGRNNVTQAAATIEGAAQLAAVGAVPAMTLGAVQAGTSAVTTRTSFASPLFDSTKAVAMHRDTDGTLSVDSGLNAGSSMKNGLGLWIMPLYQSNSAWGMEAENFKGGYKSDLGGVALGADYTVNDMFRFGLAFNIGGGYAESTGDFSKTDNSFSFWGINAYGGWSMNNFGITADVGYTGNYNKVKQELPSAMAMDDIKSDVTSSAWTAGLRGEYKFATEALDIIPHVGVRYTGLTTDEYKAKSGGDTVFKVDQDFQNIWTFPIGVTFAKEIETSSGWIVRPQVDLGITPATGDVKAKSKVRIPGVDAQAEMKMQVVDYMSYDGGVGLEMKKDNISFGINYNIQASEHRTGHGVFGTLRYEF